jgi:hypothetical protein
MGMGWFSSRRSKSSNSFPPDVAAIFEKLYAFLSSETLQNDQLPEPFRAAVVNGIGCDSLPGAVGEFGRCSTNPIPVNGSIGEAIYLSNLVTQNNQRVMFHRICAIDKIDVFELVTLDGKRWDVLFLDLYHCRKSKIAPAGYARTEGKLLNPHIYGTTACVQKFPYDLSEAVSDFYKRHLGIPMRPPQIREAVETATFVRPDKHLAAVQRILASGSSRTSFHQDFGLIPQELINRSAKRDA